MRTRIIWLLMLGVGAALGSNVILYNPTSEPIANRVSGYRLSVNDPDYRGLPTALLLTNEAVQLKADVARTNLTLCVVDGQTVRLMTQAELDEIVATNAILAAEAAVSAKLEARTFATNVVTGADGVSLYLRSMAEANWWLINNLRTNAGLPALTKDGYKGMIDTNIATFGR